MDPLVETLADPDAPSRPFEPHALAKDDTLGRYVVLDLLGSGGMGIVYACWDPELDRKVAVKLLLPSGTDDAGSSEGRAKLVREAKALAKLSHPNVVAVFDVGTFRELVYIAMEFVEGRTLSVWARERQPWPHVLAAYLQAARGLAAAHAAGLVHRDFKPDNAMIGDDGRVRVMDFGIARRADATVDGDSEPIPLTEGESEALATTGTALGTPAYMSPEQHLGLTVDARTDQFSWCVAMWEALYGERPFTGDTLAALFVAVTEGRRRPVPRGTDVPRALATVLTRGVAARREQRFATMEELTSAVARATSPRRSRRLAMGAALVVALAGAVGGTIALRHNRGLAACREASRAIEQVWNEPAAESLRASLRATGAANADQTFERARPWLDDYAERWAGARESLCIAFEVDETMTAAHHERASACLDERREALAATLEVLEEAEPTLVPRTVKAAAGLERIEPCLDPGEIGRRRSPDDPAERERLRELQGDLSRVYSLRTAGRNDAALAEARIVLANAEALAWPPLLAEARGLVGNLRGRVGEESGAIEDLQAAFELAYREGLDGLAANIASDLAFTVGVRGADHAEGLRWGRLGQAALQRMSETGGIRGAAVENSIGAVYYGMGDYATAATYYERAIAMREEVLGPDHPEVATPLSNLGVVYALQGKHDEAETAYRRAMEIAEGALGPEHIDVAGAISNLGNLEYERGRYDEALRLHERALSIRRVALGAGNPELGISLVNLGSINRRLGRYDEALALIEEALSIFEKARGPGHPDVAACLTSLAALHHARGAPEEARRTWLRAIAIHEKALGPDHPNLAEPLHNLGEVNLLLGDREAALSYFERALRVREKALGPDHAEVAHDLTGVAEALVELGRADEALPLAERAMEIRRRTEEAPEYEVKTRAVHERAQRAAADR